MVRVKKGTVLSYECNSNEYCITIYPNHYRTHEASIATL